MDAWIFGAEVAVEAEHAVFTSKKALINKKAADGQDGLFPGSRYHAVFTGSLFELVQAEGQH